MSWPSVEFPEAIRKTKVGRENQILSADIRPFGHFPVVDQGQAFVAGYSDEEGRVIRDDLPMVIFGDHTRCVKYVDFPFILGADGTKVLKPKEDLFDPKFFYYVLLSLDIPNRGYNRHFTVLKEKTIPRPDKDEQRKIAEVLGAVQCAIEQQERLLAVTAELKKTLLHKLFTQGLRGESQKQTEIGPVPESWDVVPLRDCALVQTGIAKGRKLNGKETVDLPYLRVANVQSGYLDLTEMKTITIQPKEKPRYLLQHGDVVLTEGGDFDKLGRGFIWRGQVQDCLHQNHVFAVRVDRERLLPDFFAHLSQSAYGKTYFLSVAHKTTNLACINTTKLKAFPVLVPSLDEQREIVGMLETTDAKLDLHRRKHATLTALFRTLLRQLMTAQLRVHELELPNLAPSA